MALDNSVKEEIVKKYGKSANDCGSSEVQIALLTANINCLIRFSYPEISFFS